MPNFLFNCQKTNLYRFNTKSSLKNKYKKIQLSFSPDHKEVSKSIPQVCFFFIFCNNSPSWSLSTTSPVGPGLTRPGLSHTCTHCQIVFCSMHRSLLDLPSVPITTFFANVLSVLFFVWRLGLCLDCQYNLASNGPSTQSIPS